MPFGRASRARLDTVHPTLRTFALELSKRIDAGALGPYVLDISVPKDGGWRGEEAQEDAFKRGASKLHWPDSKHNHTENGQPLSLAVDLVPYPIEWSDDRQELMLRGFALALAHEMGLKLRTIAWDLPHFELIA